MRQSAGCACRSTGAGCSRRRRCWRRARLAPAPIPLIWGSGFERATALLAELAAGRRNLGQPAGRGAGGEGSVRLRGSAAKAGHRPSRDPRSRAHGPRRLAVQACRRCRRRTCPAGRAPRPPRGRGWYWQRRARGRPVSALLLGSRVLALQRAMGDAAAGQRFRFAGAVAPASLTAVARDRLADAATQPCRSTSSSRAWAVSMRW